MLLRTSVPPRRDGTARATAPDGVTWVFAPDAAGELVCDVGDEAFALVLVRRGWAAPVDGSVMVGPDEPDEPDEPDDDDEDEGAMTAPVEANTPPVRRRGRPKKVAK